VKIPTHTRPDDSSNEYFAVLPCVRNFVKTIHDNHDWYVEYNGAGCFTC